ncbi:hypothetical protein VNI00_012104 [Paramarasmius palmivorus]|uniref:Ser-Thr-rich glycosyl-phosphatidyl-inositol-anchored membrane family-domain-containing protein n=1 Tax=Paramarasmius palmivorus TaxID=297713 RepID=A0AAW0ASR6_9AGAR
MQFKTTAILAALAAAVTASPLVERKPLDVWNPTIISPNASTIWVVGTTVNVTWDTSDQPKQISNGAAVQLRNATGPVGYLKDFNTFDLRTGWVEIEVPDVDPATDYYITLFGDSGNWSDKFAIVDSEEEQETTY